MRDDDTIDADGYLIPHNHHDTSIAAAKRAAKFSASLRKRALQVIASRGANGATCEDVEGALSHHSRQTISARLTELEQEMSIFDSIHCQQNRSGADAIIWVATASVPVKVAQPYLEYQDARIKLARLKKALVNFEQVLTFLGADDLEHLYALRSTLTEKRHALERIPKPPPLPRPVDEVRPVPTPVPSTPSKTGLIGLNGKEVLL